MTFLKVHKWFYGHVKWYLYWPNTQKVILTELARSVSLFCVWGRYHVTSIHIHICNRIPYNEDNNSYVTSHSSVFVSIKSFRLKKNGTFWCQNNMQLFKIVMYIMISEYKLLALFTAQSTVDDWRILCTIVIFIFCI